MKEAEGFSLSVDVINGTVEGGGKIPIQKSLGPLEIAALLVDLRANSFSVGIDMSFELGPIRASVFELGVRFFFKDGDGHSAGDIEPFLNGLGVAMDTSAIKLAGMFLRHEDANGIVDYLGAATVAVVGYFELSAIGGYTQVDGESSLFIFASLVAPLGGPPYFFITGIAGGFGYNRLLPPPGAVADHPFMQVMRGEVKLETLTGAFAFSKGNHWIAAGIQFRSFGFIDGKVVIAVQFGHDFAFQLLGLAAFAIEPLVYFEIGIEARADAESFQLKAGISPNSYLLHPDIFSMRGDFGLCIFYGGPHSGDFVLSIGGYHPAYKTPAHYPELNRVGIKATLYGFIRLSVDVYFACTPQALMAGASISLSAEFEGIGCGLDVYIDVFIQWDPFFIMGQLGIVLWFEFLGRHEISVKLEIHTPPLGGTATIDLEIVSFEVDFGSDLEEPPPPPLDEFFTRQLAVPARPLNGGAKVATFNTVDAAGLVRVDFLYGKTEKEPKSQSNEQEGVAKPVSVDAEFAFAVRTRLPFDEPDGVDLDAAPGTAIAGKVNVPLCEKECLTSILKISGPGTAGAQRKRLLDLYPAATFGDTLQAVQPDQAQGAIGDVDSDKPSVPLTDTVEFYYIAKLKPASPPALTSKDTEESLDNEDYPLPLGWPHPQAQVHRVTKSKLLFSTSALTLDLGASKKVVNRRASALFARQDRKATPLHVSARTAGLQRFINPVQTDASTVAEPPKDAAIISVPGSPARRAELFGVNLRIVPPHSPVSLKRQRLETLSAAKNLERRALTPRDGARGTFNTSLNIEAGKAAWIDLTGGTPVRGTLAFAGQQTVRAIFLAATGEPLGDVYVAGARSLQALPRTRRAVFIGEGLDAPLRAPAATAAAAEEEAAARVATAFPREAIGIEHDSVLLALGNGVFAGHGCILKANTSLGIAPQPLDSAPGSQVLRAATNVRVHFPALRKGWSLVLSVEPLVAEPGSAVREIRWRSLDAKLDGLHSVLTPDRTALLMSVEAAKPWSLEIDLGKKWRLAGIALVGREPRDIARTFKSKADWDLVDDRFRAAPPRTSTNITMQITQ